MGTNPIPDCFELDPSSEAVQRRLLQICSVMAKWADHGALFRISDDKSFVTMPIEVVKEVVAVKLFAQETIDKYGIPLGKVPLS